MSLWRACHPVECVSSSLKPPSPSFPANIPPGLLWCFTILGTHRYPRANPWYSALRVIREEFSSYRFFGCSLSTCTDISGIHLVFGRLNKERRATNLRIGEKGNGHRLYNTVLLDSGILPVSGCYGFHSRVFHCQTVLPRSPSISVFIQSEQNISGYWKEGSRFSLIREGLNIWFVLGKIRVMRKRIPAGRIAYAGN
jgi:hypothetical protein